MAHGTNGGGKTMRGEKRLDIEQTCELAVLEKSVGYPLAAFLVAMKDKSEYSGSNQGNGYLVGNKTALGQAVGCKSETVVRVYGKLRALAFGGNDSLRALPSENPRELIFFSSRMKNSLDAMAAKKEFRAESRARRAENAKQKAAAETPRESEESDAQGETAAPREYASERLRELWERHAALSKIIARGDGNDILREQRAELEREIQQLEREQTETPSDSETADSRAVDGAKSAGTGESEESDVSAAETVPVAEKRNPDSPPQDVAALIPAVLKSIALKPAPVPAAVDSRAA